MAFKTHEAFYHVLRTRELLELQEHRADQAQSQHVIAAARYEAGMLAHLDLLGVELDKDRAEAERRDAERRHEAARRTLSEMTGLDPLPPLHWAEVDFTFSPIGITLHEALAQALRTHPDVGSAHFALKAAERRLEHARISQLPPVQVSRVELEVERAQIRLAQVKREVDREVRLIWDELRSAETTVALREKDLALANQRLEVAEARYDTGGISLIELFAAAHRGTPGPPRRQSSPLGLQPQKGPVSPAHRRGPARPHPRRV